MTELEWKDRSCCVCWKCLLHIKQLDSPISFSEVHLWLVQEHQQCQMHCLHRKSQPLPPYLHVHVRMCVMVDGTSDEESLCEMSMLLQLIHPFLPCFFLPPSPPLAPLVS